MWVRRAWVTGSVLKRISLKLKKTNPHKTSPPSQRSPRLYRHFSKLMVSCEAWMLDPTPSRAPCAHKSHSSVTRYRDESRSYEAPYPYSFLFIVAICQGFYENNCLVKPSSQNLNLPFSIATCLLCWESSVSLWKESLSTEVILRRKNLRGKNRIEPREKNTPLAHPMDWQQTIYTYPFSSLL